MRKSEIIEVYSASDSLEAHAVANMLREEGINAQVVGDPLSTGAFPLSDPSLSTRVWVDSVHAGRAREIVDRWEWSLAENLEEESTTSEELEDDTVATEPQPDVEQATSFRAAETRQQVARFFSRALMAIGLLIAAIGLVSAAINGKLRARYSEVVNAQLIATPVQLVESRETIAAGSYRWFPEYEYQLDGQRYVAKLTLDYYPPDTRLLHVDPGQPDDYYGTDIAHPAWYAGIGILLGGLVAFIGWQFR